jgi:hypothetical protein
MNRETQGNLRKLMDISIENDHQYAVLRDSAHKIAESIKKWVDQLESGESDLNPQVIQAQIASLESVYSQFSNLLSAYETDLKVGQIFWIKTRQMFVAGGSEFQNAEVTIQGFNPQESQILVRFNPIRSDTLRISGWVV